MIHDRFHVPRSPALLVLGLACASNFALLTAAAAQQAAPQQQQQAPQQQAPQQQQQQFQPSPVWGNLPRMQLERQYAGPLQDTIIQRWRDPADGSVCYIYLPISAPVAPPASNGFMQYGPNAIGSISCLPPRAAPQQAPRK